MPKQAPSLRALRQTTEAAEPMRARLEWTELTGVAVAGGGVVPAMGVAVAGGGRGASIGGWRSPAAEVHRWARARGN